MDCKHATGLISQAMDQRLGLADRIQLRIHLVRCDGCKNFSGQMMFLRSSTQVLLQRITKDKT